ncbi:hypothetical protein AB669_16805 [Pedobacter sp. BMA]|nr:hypothetical protein AB669_16805 [Pedobacter sp. BMA]
MFYKQFYSPIFAVYQHFKQKKPVINASKPISGLLFTFLDLWVTNKFYQHDNQRFNSFLLKN